MMLADRLHNLWERLTGRDLIKKSHENVRATRDEMDTERLTRVRTLEVNARASAANFRAAKLFDAALIEKEKADALRTRRRTIERRRERVEDLRLSVIRDDYRRENK